MFNSMTGTRTRMSCRVLGLAFFVLVFGASPPARAQTNVDHLPEAIRGEVLAWRARLDSARALKVVSDTDQTWQRFYQLEADGRPHLGRREQFQAHSWMTAEGLWFTVFPVVDGKVNLELPRSQIYWDLETRIVRERYWDEQAEVFRAHRYVETDYEFGPGDARVAGCKGCIDATILNSWLVIDPAAGKGSGSREAVALNRTPDLAVIPPESGEPGIWFDVFKELPERDREPSESDLYRRNDLVLLSRNAAEEPEVREWGTIVMTDPERGGQEPAQIIGSRRFRYEFHEDLPEAIGLGIRAFIHEIDLAADSGAAHSHAGRP
jgi:hypothetical protein